MNTSRKTTLEVTMHLSELIAALKAFHPHDLTIQALPGDGKGAAVTTMGGAHIRIQFEKDT